ncbi:MAG TPA: hypothetical protein VFH68_23755 [Polyangia bacterium]|jgi:hypothetical protein|nr:hypothetical protein [Polyangia bacterium]
MTTPAPIQLPDTSTLRTRALERVRIDQPLFETDPQLLAGLLEAGQVGDPQWAAVIASYLTDVKLAAPGAVQEDLFRAMLPFVWGIWQHALVAGVGRDAASALSSMLFHKPRLIAELAGAPAQDRVESFVQASLLAAIAGDARVSVDLTWSPFWVAACACWPQLAAGLWDELLRCRHENHARALLAYLARLAYPDAENPLLSQATRPVELWSPASLDSDLCWGLEAVAALARRLSWDSVEANLGRILVRMVADPALEVARFIATDLREPRRGAFVRRSQILLQNLGKPGGDKFWSDDPGIG